MAWISTAVYKMSAKAYYKFSHLYTINIRNSLLSSNTTLPSSLNVVGVFIRYAFELQPVSSAHGHWLGRFHVNKLSV